MNSAALLYDPNKLLMIYIHTFYDQVKCEKAGIVNPLLSQSFVHTKHRKSFYKTINLSYNACLLTVSSFGSCFVMFFSNEMVGFLAVSRMSSTFLSPRSSRPLARIPTLITPFSSRAAFLALIEIKAWND